MSELLDTLLPRNNLLTCLRKPDLDLIYPHFRTLASESNHLLYDPGQGIETVYFPCANATVSFMVSADDGHIVETLIVGREGAVGGIVSHGHLPAYTRIMVQQGGSFIALPVSVLDGAKKVSRSLDNLFARYADCMLAQIFQATACNATHSIEQRTARWILAAAERTESLEISLTQERLSAMLGVGRSYVSRIIKIFKREQLLTVRRGRIVVHDLESLKAKACTCNEAVKAHFDTVLAGVYPSLD